MLTQEPHQPQQATATVSPAATSGGKEEDVEVACRLARATASFAPPPDEWASWLSSSRPPLSSVISAFALRVVDSGDKAKKRPALLKNVALRARLGHSLGIFGGTSKSRKRLITILARENVSKSAAFELTGELRKAAEQGLPMLKFGYVYEDNALYPGSTPSEEIHLNLSLQNPDLDKEEIKMRAEALLKATGLDNVRHKAVRLLNDAQRKAMAIALEMAADPDVLVLDEPFSSISGEGQARQKLHLATLLSHLASSKRCFVVYTGAECDAMVYESAHDVMILSQGPTSTVLFHCAPKSDAASVKTSETSVWSSTNAVEAILLSSKFSSAESDALVVPLNLPQTNGASHSFAECSPRKTSLLHGLWGFFALVAREFKFTKRDPRLLRSRVISTAITSTFVALILMHAADQNNPSYSGGTHISATLLTLTVPGLMTISINMSIISDIRSAILRETSHGVAGPVSVFLARLIPELIVNFIVAVVFMLIMYWAVGFAAPFMMFIAAMMMFLETCVSYCHLIGISVANKALASKLGMLTMLPQYLFIGLFVRIRTMPVFLRWVNYICHAMYAIRFLAPEELSQDRCQAQFTCLTWSGFLDQNLIFKDDQWWNALVLTMFFLVTRILAILVASYKDHYLFLKGRS